MKRYDLMLNGRLHLNLAEETLTEMFRMGQIDRHSVCRLSGTSPWKDLDECLPLLKYESAGAIPAGVPPLPPPPFRTPRYEANLRTDEAGRKPKTTALRAGWICFGIAAAAAWIFPPAYLFYSVAIITAIVAMCTHQVNQGLILLLSSFLGIGLSALMSMFLAVGLFALAAAPALEKTSRDLERLRQTQAAAQRQMQAAQARLLQSLPAPPRFEPPPFPSQTPSAPSTSAEPWNAPYLQEKANRQNELQASPQRQAVSAHAQPIPSIPHVENPPARRSQPAPAPLETWSQRDLLAEIARIEQQQRRARQSGQEISPATADYLARLHAAYAHVTRK